jgi:FkbM family methyltransferase
MREVCLTGRYEPQETEIVRRVLRPGDVFVDVGANWGYFTLLAAHLVGPNGRVVSVEADPRASQSLREHAATNQLHWVTPVEIAADRGDGSVVLRAYGSVASTSSNLGVAASTTVVSGAPPFVVRTRALDDVLDESGIDRVQLLKMDIEGAESRAIDGLQRRLRAHLVDRLVLELHPAHLRDQGSSVEAVISALRGHNYHAWQIDHSRTAHRRTAAGVVAVASLLKKLSYPAASDLGEWPHLLWVRDGLPPLL